MSRSRHRPTAPLLTAGLLALALLGDTSAASFDANAGNQSSFSAGTWIAFEGTVGTLDCGGTSSVVQVPAGGIPIGRTLVIRVALREGPGTVSVTDTSSNSYTVDQQRTEGFMRTVTVSGYVSTALAAGDSITVSLPSSKVQAVSVFRFIGLAATGVVEVANNGGPGNPITVSATTVGRRLLFAAGSEKDFGTITQPTGWTNLGTRNVECGARKVTDLGAFRIEDAAAWTYSPSSTRSDTWAATLVAYGEP